MGKTNYRRLVLLVFVLFPAFSLLFGGGTLSAKIVRGTVLSATDNEPLIGATLKVEGSKNVAVTDLEGNFSIEANDGQTLIASYVGFVDQRVKVTGNNLTIKAH